MSLAASGPARAQAIPKPIDASEKSGQPDPVVPPQTPGAAATAGSLPETPGPSSTLFAAPFYSCTRNFYVATTGKDSNAGTQASPWLTIQHADSTARQPGDCINVAAGTYQAQVLIQHGGNAPTATGYVAYRCQTLDACHVLAPRGGHLWGIANTAFVVIDGFEIDGNNALLKDGIADACVGSDGATYGTGKSAHHIWVVNNILHHCNLAGVSLNNKEWYYVIHNTLYHNSWTSGYQGSGISFVNTQCIEKGNASCASGTTYDGGTGTYVPSGMDLTFLAPFHNIVSENIAYDNEIAPSNPVACGAHTDGNGIIMDTFLDEPTLTIMFPYQTLVTGNTSYANGGRGIHVFRASNVTVANNTVYGNGTDTCIDSYYLGDLSMQGGSNNVWVNNIAQAVTTATNATCGSGSYCGGRNAAMVAGNGAGIVNTNNTYARNIFYGANGVQLFDNDVAYLSCVTNKCLVNPMLTNPVASNFAPASNSPAIAYAATETYLPATMTAYLPAASTTAGACVSGSTTACP